MLYTITIHHYLGACANHKGRRRTHCYGNKFLLFAWKFKRFHAATYHVSITSGILSRNLGNGVFKVPRSKKVIVKNA